MAAQKTAADKIGPSALANALLSKVFVSPMGCGNLLVEQWQDIFHVLKALFPSIQNYAVTAVWISTQTIIVFNNLPGIGFK